MKTMAMIAATMIAAAGLGTAAQAAETRPVMSGQEKAVRYQHDQQEKRWHEQRLGAARASESATFGAPNRQTFGRAEAQGEPDNGAPSSFSIPGSESAFYNYTAGSKSWAYGY